MAILLRLLAAVLVRGKDAPFIRHDLDEMYQRDRERGMSAWRAQGRYARYLLGSAFSVWRDRLRSPRLPRVQWLDVKLALRMLVRYPGLTFVGGLALAFGIPVALAPIQLANAINAPLPFEDADRIVALEYSDRVDSKLAMLHDYERWRRELTSFELLAAAQPRTENLAGSDWIDVVSGGEMTASAFAVARVPPLLGRTLLESDEAKGAVPVVVIGYDLWQTRFGGAADVLGRTLRVGRTTSTIVGVMPAGFLFPKRQKFWVPLQARAVDYEFGAGPALWVFGRLRHGVSRDQAQAEFATVGRRTAADHRPTHTDVQANLVPYQHHVSGLKPTPDRIWLLYLTSMLLLAVACGNVGTLMLARTAARSNEIAVRSALGAGRSRIVMQLFIEALVLSVLAGGVGLAAADVAMSQLPIVKRFEGAMPFWFSLRVRPSTLAAAAGFAIFSAVIAGLLPALKATGRRAYGVLQRQRTGSGVRFGMTATVLIVAEVAIAVGGLTGVAAIGRGAFRERALGEGIVADEYLTATIRLPGDLLAGDGPAAARTAQLVAVQNEAARQLMADANVRGVSFAGELPGMRHPRGQIEVEGGSTSGDDRRVHIVNRAWVDPQFFEVLGQAPLQGRLFETLDLAAPRRPVVVNRSFVDDVLHGGNAVGRRIRYLRGADTSQAPWLEIVGVVNDLGMNIVDPQKTAGVYNLSAPGEIRSPKLLVRVAGDATAFVPRLRTLLLSVEPELVLGNPVPLNLVFSEALMEAQISAVVFAVIGAIAVALSAAGLYALMAFSVAERTREIAIRSALGARPARIVAGVVSRALLQLLVGVGLGAAVAVLIVPEVLNSSTMVDNWRQMLAAVSFAMLLIGLLACVVPTRRALRIQPVEALKELG